MKKWADELNTAFSKKKSKWLKYTWKILTIPGHKGNANQNHSTSLLLRFHLTMLESLPSRRQITTNIDKDMGKKEPSYIADINVN
jgi:hypothetical protein